MVSRRRPLIALSLLALAAVGAGPDPPPIERRPYRVRARVAVDPSARLDARARAALVASWRSLAGRFVGAPWDLRVDDGPGPLANANLDALKAEALAGDAAGADKLWLLEVAAEGPGLAFAGREYDAASGILGPTCRRSAPSRVDAARELLRLSLALFEPSALIGEEAGGGVAIRVQGASLAPADPAGRVVGPGAVFRAFRIFEKPDGSTLRLDAIKSTYLKVDSVDGGVARCKIISAYGSPLTRKVVQRNRLIALGVRPSAEPTRLRFLGPPPEKVPAAGFALTSRPAAEAPPREVGTTDREGRVVLAPGFASGLTLLRLMAADVEPLAEFPLVPGEAPEERTIVLASLMDEAVAFQTRLVALRDEVVDLVARRARIESLLKSRAEGEAWPEVRALLDDYGRLTPRSAVLARLQKLEDDARRAQTPRIAVLTRSAQALLADTKGLVDRYLDDEAVKIYDESYRQSQGGAPAAATAGVKGAREEPSLQGIWRLAAAEPPAPADPGNVQTLTLRGTSVAIVPAAGEPLAGTFRLDAAHQPRGIDLSLIGQGEDLLGIYELKGDRLALCIAPPGAARPTRFEAPPESGLRLYRYEKVGAAPPAVAKPAKKPPAAGAQPF